MRKVVCFILSLLMGIAITFTPIPEGVSSNGIYLLAIFVFMVLVQLTKALPIGSISLIAIAIIIISKTLSFKDAFSGFTYPVVWLVAIAFFISKGFVKTGFGHRLAYRLISIFGKRTLGLAYTLTATDLILSPFVPSMTARLGGILFPIINSISRAFGSYPKDGARKMGAYLIQNSFQVNLVTSALFITAMAGNPFIIDIARDHNIHITWQMWSLNAAIPAFLSLLILPYFIYKIYPPEIKKTPNVTKLAKKELKRLGKIGKHEWYMVAIFVIVVALWIGGKWIHVTSIGAAFIGLTLMILTRIMKWKDILEARRAWETLIWFATLLMLATHMKDSGLVEWFTNFATQYSSDFTWQQGFGILLLFFFISHYFFASTIAHIATMFAPFLILALSLGVPPIIATLTLGFFSSLYGGVTHYSSGPAPILFGSGYVHIGRWWLMGLICAIVNSIIWLGIGWLIYLP